LNLKILSFLLSVLSIAPLFADPGIAEKADQLTEQGKINECRALLEKALPAASSDFEKSEIYWRLSRTRLFLTQVKRQENRKQDELLHGFEEGVFYATEALKINASSYMAYFWRASNWGSWAQIKNNFDSLGKAGLVKDDLTMALRIKPDFSAACYVLGLTYGSLPGWPFSFGNKDYAVSLLRRSVDIAEKKESALGFYLDLAAILWERNWDANTRQNNRWGMSNDFTNKTDPAEKYCFYEAIVEFGAIPPYAMVSLSKLSDRDEARCLVDFVEARLPEVVKNAHDREESQKLIRELRSKWK
jgi:tetratricopeptide (TPR) repeat protein